MSRRSLKQPITLAVVIIVLLVLLLVGWIILTVRNAIQGPGFPGIYWALLSVGAAFFVAIIVGVVLYLTLSIKAINISQRQQNFIDSVTHELKSPIASLKLYLQTLTRRAVPENEREEFYRCMLEDVDRLDQLINDILDAARLERKEERTEIVDVVVSEILRDSAASVCTRHRVPASTVTFDLTECVVSGTRVNVELIFRNLIDNAVKYAGDPPEVGVQMVQLYDGRVAVRISDNGSGIPIRQRKKIFGRFVRLGTELERKKKGTGLGLYIVRTLVRKMGGNVRVRSREKVSGTIFEVTLPGRLLEEPKSQEQAKSRTVASSSANLT